MRQRLGKQTRSKLLLWKRSIKLTNVWLNKLRKQEKNHINKMQNQDWTRNINVITLAEKGYHKEILPTIICQQIRLSRIKWAHSLKKNVDSFNWLEKQNIWGQREDSTGKSAWSPSPTTCLIPESYMKGENQLLHAVLQPHRHKSWYNHPFLNKQMEKPKNPTPGVRKMAHG